MARIFLVCVFGVVATVRPTFAETIFVAVGGDDRNDGRSLSRPVATLQRAQEIAASVPPADMRIEVGPGRYSGQTVKWTYTMPNYAIEIVGAGGGKTVFDGERRGTSFFRLLSRKGEPTNIHLRGLTISHYVTAIVFAGNREIPGLYNSNNSIVDNQFLNVGGLGHDPMGYSVAVVGLVNSRRNVIRRNLFQNMVGTDCEHLHGVYAAHYSNQNEIEENRFENGCGDPIRLRDASNQNVVRSNEFVGAGARAGISEWWCAGRSGCTKGSPECPPLHNVYKNNVLLNDLPEVYRFNRPIPAGCSDQ